MEARRSRRRCVIAESIGQPNSSISAPSLLSFLIPAEGETVGKRNRLQAHQKFWGDTSNQVINNVSEFRRRLKVAKVLDDRWRPAHNRIPILRRRPMQPLNIRP